MAANNASLGTAGDVVGDHLPILGPEEKAVPAAPREEVGKGDVVVVIIEEVFCPEIF